MENYNVNTDKCEVCIFSKKDLNTDDKKLSVDTINFKYSSNPKLLGVFLDEKLKFDEHVSHVERRENIALRKIREIFRTGQDLKDQTITDIQQPCPFNYGICLSSLADNLYGKS